MWPFSEISKLSNRLDQMENSLKGVLSVNEKLNKTIKQQNEDIKERDESIKKAQTIINEQKEKIDAINTENEAIREQIHWLEEDQRIQSEMKIIIPQRFRAVEEAIRAREPFIFVHGGAGTGKSTLIRWLMNKELIHIVLAPTGLAALNVGGMTIHKAFQFPPLDLFPKKDPAKSIPRDFLSVLNNLKKQNRATICIDEISMVRADLLDSIDRALRHHYGPMPFGGFQMVFVGDLFQLPPVVSKDNDNDPNSIDPKPFFDPNDKKYPGDAHGWKSEWFLDSNVLTPYWRNIKRIDLNDVFRQVGAQKFVNNLNQIRRRVNRSVVVAELNQVLQCNNASQDDQVVIVGKNDQANEENNRRLAQLRGKEQYFKATKTGVFEQTKEKDLPVPNDVTLKVGEFVIIVANSPDGDYVNGTTGIICGYVFDPVTCETIVLVKTSSGLAKVKVFKWTKYRLAWSKESRHFINIEDGTYEQIPIIPGYAITCHKAQGKTLEKVFIDVDRCFASGQMYVALSRTRSPRDITLKRALSVSDFVPNSRLIEFSRMGLI